VLLYDPVGQEGWAGPFRVIAYVRASLQAPRSPPTRWWARSAGAGSQRRSNHERRLMRHQAVP
jgi:hypothetical protein